MTRSSWVGTLLSSTVSPNGEASSPMPIGASREIGSRAKDKRRAVPGLNKSPERLPFSSCASSAALFTGNRIVRAFLPMAFRMAWRIHQTAYEMK